MEELIEILMKKYPNYIDLGRKIHEIHNKLKKGKKYPIRHGIQLMNDKS